MRIWKKTKTNTAMNSSQASAEAYPICPATAKALMKIV